MRDDEDTIEYTVVVSGDQWDHQAFRESVGEIDTAEIESESNRDDDATDFEPLSAEDENLDVGCAHCGAVLPCGDASATIDSVAEAEAGHIISIERYYLCSQECAKSFALEVAGVEE